MIYDLDNITEKVSKKIDADRLRHTIGVEYTAASMAMVLGANKGAEFMEKAMVAGLLHDNAKCMPPEKLLEKSIKHGLELTEAERKNPFLLHGKLGAYYAHSRYGIDDSDILNAITWHTTGRPDMSLLEKIIFTADYIEPGRTKQPRLDDIRKLAFTDIDSCVYAISDDTLNYLSGRKRCIDAMTVKTRDFYKSLSGR